ncbi:hypothetical protein HPB49_017768 [Dermacentor silvarum]|uniref:Uncharacterized protein n=1 Tax=Dermacentor silvarum TaxID=543639 RepID=A0ACB8CYK2_DERSI|nr:hypothetical protein HPB49_017768 [Dermacentor silvarum]
MKARIEDRIVYSPYPHIDIPLYSFYSLAKEKLLINPNKMALVSDILSLTRAEVLAGMQRYAIGFRQNGMLPGDNVCIHLNNSVENLIAIYGCILAGATVFLASPFLTECRTRKPIVLPGDFNAKHQAWGYPHTTRKGENLWQAAADLGLT